MYAKLAKLLKSYFKSATIFKYGLNYSPMYRRSTGKLIAVSDNLYVVDIHIPLSYKNRNYVGSIFGGSLFSATDPIFMVQLINILGNQYVVWDKAATIYYKRPARQTAYATFEFTQNEINKIKADVLANNEITLIKH